MLAHAKDAFSEELADLRAKYVGNFNTHLTCNCGHAITDHATENNSSAHSRDDFELLQGFAVVHHYWCDLCGAPYVNTVIEGSRGYTPRERPK
jgi:hypothetical protein